MRVHRATAAAADLRWRGFSPLEARAPGHPTTPEHATVEARPPWHTTPQGWCTRYGNVRELVSERDGRLVIMNGGDALGLSFDAAAFPDSPPGMVRTFFFESVGWDKDADHNVIDGGTVEPLPIEPERRGGWELEYSTRWVPQRIAEVDQR
jgi:hypothetical protein